jgi:hypothetical protein
MIDTAAFFSALRMVLTADDDKTQQVSECVQYVEHVSEQLQALGLPSQFQGPGEVPGAGKELA